VGGDYGPLIIRTDSDGKVKDQSKNPKEDSGATFSINISIGANAHLKLRGKLLLSH